MEGLEDGTYESLAKAAQANDLSKASFGHRKNGRCGEITGFTHVQLIKATVSQFWGEERWEHVAAERKRGRAIQIESI